MHREYMPGGGQQSGPVSRRRIQKLKEGGERARTLYRERETEHEQEELPAAEAELAAALEAFPEEETTTPLTKPPAPTPKQRSWLQQFFSLFTRK